MPISTGGVASSKLWTPPPSAYLELWLDAADTSTFTFSSGNIVSEWRDKSVNAYVFQQSNSSARPARSGTQNGLPTLVFDGSDDCLYNTAAASTWTWLHDGTSNTVFTVIKNTTPTGSISYALSTVAFGINTEIGTQIWVNTFGTTADYRAQQWFNGNSSGSVYCAPYSSNVTSSRWLTSMHLNNINSGTMSFKSLGYVNNTNIAFSVASGTWTAPASTSAPTTTLYVGGNSGNFSPLNGQIAEILIYKTYATSSLQNQVFNYLRKKWAITYT